MGGSSREGAEAGLERLTPSGHAGPGPCELC